MKKIFVYFDNIAMCENTAQAVEFINSLPGLICNQHTVKLLDDLFEGKKDYYGEEIKSLATTGCGKSRIRIYDALGDTLEEHQEEYIRRQTIQIRKSEIKRNNLMKERSQNDRNLIKLLMKKNEGSYFIRMTIWKYDKDPVTGNFQQSAEEMSFSCTVKAVCGAEAYAKAVEKAINTHDVVDYVNMTDSRFECKLIKE